jgi:hypothetical protein
MMFTATYTDTDRDRATAGANESSHVLAGIIGGGSAPQKFRITDPLHRFTDKDRLPGPRDYYAAYVLRDSSLPARLISPGRWSFMGTGLAGGLLLGLGFIAFRRFTNGSG